MVNVKKHRELEYWNLYRPTSFDYWLIDFFNKDWGFYFLYTSGIYGCIARKKGYWNATQEKTWELINGEVGNIKYNHQSKPIIRYAYTKYGAVNDERYLCLSIFDEYLRNQLFSKTKQYLQKLGLNCAFIDLGEYLHNVYSLFKLIEESNRYDMLFINNTHPNFDSFLLEYGIRDKIDYVYCFHGQEGCSHDAKIFESLGMPSHPGIVLYELQEGNNHKISRDNKSGLDLLDNYLEWRKLHLAPTRESSEYKKMKRRVRKRDNNTCQCCGYYSNKKTHHKLEVHHIYGYKDHLDYRTEEDNCITLCNDCHKRYHSLYGKSDVNPLTFAKFIRDYNQYFRNEQVTFDNYMGE